MRGGEGEQPIELAPEVPDHRRRRLGPLLLALVAVGAAITAVVALGDPGAVDLAVDETTPTTAPSTPDVGFPTPIALGGPTDGKESIGLPVRAEPSTGLVDGQEVTVTGTGFPPDVSVGVVMCTREAGREHGARGVEACNIGHFAQATSDADGVAVVTFSVRRLVLLDGQEVDCASESQRCLLGMGMISDYDTSGGVLVDFDPTVPLPDPPSATVDPVTGLRDGDRVRVEVEGLLPRGTASVSLCDERQQMCIDLGPGGHRSADEGGTAVLEVRVWRQFGVPMWGPEEPARNIDCALERCVLQVWAERSGTRAIPVVVLGFDPAGPIREAPTLTVTTAGPHRAGDHLEIVVGPVPPGTGAEPLLCSTRHCGGGLLGSDQLGDHLRVRFQLEPGVCSAGDCMLGVHLYGPGDGTPPLLVPAPVELELAG